MIRLYQDSNTSSAQEIAGLEDLPEYGAPQPAAACKARTVRRHGRVPVTQTARLALPLALRALITARPPRVRILSRKP